MNENIPPIIITQRGATVYVQSGPANVAIDGTDFRTDSDWRVAVLSRVREFLPALKLPEGESVHDAQELTPEVKNK